MTVPSTSFQQSLCSQRKQALSGKMIAPGDKSISHRSLILGALASGQTCITGLLESDDVLATARALSGLGVIVEKSLAGEWLVTGMSGRFRPTTRELDLGNSGTGVRLLMGAITGAGGKATLTGDSSLASRPMARILDPLALMGARCRSDNGRLLVDMEPSPLTGIDYTPPMASAQVKSAILLAGLGASGQTTVREPAPTRDHTERMLPLFGGELMVEQKQGVTVIRLSGPQALQGTEITVPGDPSSAAFATVAGLIVPESAITIRRVMNNPARMGVYEVLQRMGAEIMLIPCGQAAGEDIVDIIVHASSLRAIDLEADIAPSMIDEYPVLAVAAAFATGTTRLRGLSELRAKESDRLAGTAKLLTTNGVDTRIDADDLIIVGTGQAGPEGGGRVASHGDHRLAMSALVLGMATANPVHTDGASMIATSYPGFVADMTALGAEITPQ